MGVSKMVSSAQQNRYFLQFLPLSTWLKPVEEVKPFETWEGHEFGQSLTAWQGANQGTSAWKHLCHVVQCPDFVAPLKLWMLSLCEIRWFLGDSAIEDEAIWLGKTKPVQELLALARVGHGSRSGSLRFGAFNTW